MRIIMITTETLLLVMAVVVLAMGIVVTVMMWQSHHRRKLLRRREEIIEREQHAVDRLACEARSQGLHEGSRREERQLDASARTVSRLISRRVRLSQMLGSGLLAYIALLAIPVAS